MGRGIGGYGSSYEGRDLDHFAGQVHTDREGTSLLAAMLTRQLEARVLELEEQEKRCRADKEEMKRMMSEVQDRSEEVFKEQVSISPGES
jgi:hypothetical protein